MSENAESGRDANWLSKMQKELISGSRNVRQCHPFLYTGNTLLDKSEVLSILSVTINSHLTFESDEYRSQCCEKVRHCTLGLIHS